MRERAIAATFSLAATFTERRHSSGPSWMSCESVETNCSRLGESESMWIFVNPNASVWIHFKVSRIAKVNHPHVQLVSTQWIRNLKPPIRRLCLSQKRTACNRIAIKFRSNFFSNFRYLKCWFSNHSERILQKRCHKWCPAKKDNLESDI